MLVFSAICPHPPIIIPTIGKNSLSLVDKTISAMKKLEHELYASKPDLILIISPHGHMISDAFSINLHTKYQVNFEAFGDWQSKMEFKSRPEFVTKIKERVETELPVSVISEENLDHGSGVPLFYLTAHLKNIPIVPISYSFLNLDKHYKFGQLLNEEIAKSDLRIAVIASGDLSHCLTKDAPAPYSPKGQEFDNQLIKYLEKKEYSLVLNLDEGFVEEAAECGLRSFAILLGITEEYEHDVEIMSYEGPLGVGYLVANFKLK
jgi:MEMO1 family protein